MPIDNTTPVVIPPISAVPEREFDQLWLKSITISAPNPTEGHVTIESVPYSSLSGAFAPEDAGEGVIIETDTLWTAVSALSSVAAAMEAIFVATEDLRDWLEDSSP